MIFNAMILRTKMDFEQTDRARHFFRWKYFQIISVFEAQYIWVFHDSNVGCMEFEATVCRGICMETILVYFIPPMWSKRVWIIALLSHFLLVCYDKKHRQWNVNPKIVKYMDGIGKRVIFISHFVNILNENKKDMSMKLRSFCVQRGILFLNLKTRTNLNNSISKVWRPKKAKVSDALHAQNVSAFFCQIFEIGLFKLVRMFKF